MERCFASCTFLELPSSIPCLLLCACGSSHVWFHLGRFCFIRHVLSIGVKLPDATAQLLHIPLPVTLSPTHTSLPSGTLPAIINTTVRSSLDPSRCAVASRRLLLDASTLTTSLRPATERAARTTSVSPQAVHPPSSRPPVDTTASPFTDAAPAPPGSALSSCTVPPQRDVAVTVRQFGITADTEWGAHVSAGLARLDGMATYLPPSTRSFAVAVEGARLGTLTLQRMFVPPGATLRMFFDLTLATVDTVQVCACLERTETIVGSTGGGGNAPAAAAAAGSDAGAGHTITVRKDPTVATSVDDVLVYTQSALGVPLLLHVPPSSPPSFTSSTGTCRGVLCVPRLGRAHVKLNLTHALSPLSSPSHVFTLRVRSERFLVNRVPFHCPTRCDRFRRRQCLVIWRRQCVL